MSEPESSLLPPLPLSQCAAPPPAPPVEDLQFQHAEYAPAVPRQACAFCKADAGESYYRVGGAAACHGCAARLRDMQIRPDRKTFWLRAAPWGLGAAIAGSIIFALISLTGFQFALVAILVGFMVGKAIRRATRGRSSRACQVMAVILTYGAITTSYLPFFIAGAVKQMNKQAKTKPAAAASVPTIKPKQMSLGRAFVAMIAGLLLLTGIALVMPFIIIAQAPVSGLINLVIIFIGLSKAWRLTAPFSAPIDGPFQSSPPETAPAG